MDVRTHRLVFSCTDCDKEITILNVFVNRMGEMIVEGLCVPCGKERDFVSTFQQIFLNCVHLDVLFPYEQQMKEGDET